MMVTTSPTPEAIRDALNVIEKIGESAFNKSYNYRNFLNELFRVMYRNDTDQMFNFIVDNIHILNEFYKSYLPDGEYVTEKECFTIKNGVLEGKRILLRPSSSSASQKSVFYYRGGIISKIVSYSYNGFPYPFYTVQQFNAKGEFISVRSHKITEKHVEPLHPFEENLNNKIT